MPDHNTIPQVAVALVLVAAVGCNLPSSNPGLAEKNTTPTGADQLLYKFPLVELSNGEVVNVVETNLIREVHNLALIEGDNISTKFVDSLINSLGAKARTRVREFELPLINSENYPSGLSVNLRGVMEYDQVHDMHTNSFTVLSYDPKSNTLLVQLTYDGEIYPIEERSFVLYEMAYDLRLIDLLLQSGIKPEMLLQTYQAVREYMKTSLNTHGYPLETEIHESILHKTCMTARLTGYESEWITQEYCEVDKSFWDNNLYTTTAPQYNSWLDYYYRFIQRSGVSIVPLFPEASQESSMDKYNRSNFHSQVFREMSDPLLIQHDERYIESTIIDS